LGCGYANHLDNVHLQAALVANMSNDIGIYCSDNGEHQQSDRDNLREIFKFSYKSRDRILLVDAVPLEADFRLEDNISDIWQHFTVFCSYFAKLFASEHAL
jgi:hypothetical protein